MEDKFSFSSKDSLRFVMQGLFSTVILMFCIGQIISKSNGDRDTALYWGGITSILAYWMPSPVSGNGNSRKTLDESTTTVLDSSRTINVGTNPPEPPYPTIDLNPNNPTPSAPSNLETGTDSTVETLDLPTKTWQ